MVDELFITFCTNITSIMNSFPFLIASNTLYKALLSLYLMTTDMAPEATPITALNRIPKYPLLCLFNWGSKEDISSINTFWMVSLYCWYWASSFPAFWLKALHYYICSVLDDSIGLPRDSYILYYYVGINITKLL